MAAATGAAAVWVYLVSLHVGLSEVSSLSVSGLPLALLPPQLLQLLPHLCLPPCLCLPPRLCLLTRKTCSTLCLPTMELPYGEATDVMIALLTREQASYSLMRTSTRRCCICCRSCSWYGA